MGLSVEAIIAVIALFVALIQSSCSLWKCISRRKKHKETLPIHTIGNTTSPHISQDLRWKPYDKHNDPTEGIYYKARKWEWEYYAKHRDRASRYRCSEDFYYFHR